MTLFRRPSQAELVSLRELASPWRTRVQLRRLSELAGRGTGPFEFAVLGDVEPGRFWIFRAMFNRPGVFARHLAAIRRQSVDFTFQLGDMVSCGRPRHYLGFFRQLQAAPPDKPYLTVIGNHDRHHPHGRAHSRLYRSLLGSCNYRFDYRGVRFVALDSSLQRLTRRQLRWLSRVLDTPLRKVVFTHMPPVVLRLWGGGAAHHFGGFKEGAREFTEILSRKGVERVYMGHVHCFGVQDLGGVRYILTGGGGSPLFPSGAPDRFHHYLTVSATARGLREHVHSLDGSSFRIPEGKVLLPAYA